MVGRWSGVVASTTRTKHCFMCRPSSQDPWRSCRKPHLLPWSGAIGPQPDPNKHHPSFPPQKEKEIERESGGARGGGRREIRSEGFSRAEGVRGEVVGGRGAEEGKPQEDYERWAPRFSSTSPFWKPLYRHSDAFWSTSSQPVLPASLYHPEPLHPLQANHNSRWQTAGVQELLHMEVSPPPASDVAAGESFLMLTIFYSIYPSTLK